MIPSFKILFAFYYMSCNVSMLYCLPGFKKFNKYDEKQVKL